MLVCKAFLCTMAAHSLTHCHLCLNHSCSSSGFNGTMKCTDVCQCIHRKNCVADGQTSSDGSWNDQAEVAISYELNSHCTQVKNALHTSRVGYWISFI